MLPTPFMATEYLTEENMGFAIAASPSTPASRQKNCNSCVQAKRRCDRRMPICSRCAEKKLACVYSKSRTAHRTGNNSRGLAPCTEALPLDGPGLSFDIDCPEGISTGFHPGVAAETTPQSNQDTVSSSDISMDTFMHFLENNISSSSDQWLVHPEEDHLLERPLTPVEEEVGIAYSKMAACEQLNLSPWQAYDPKTSLYYILNRVRAFTVEMAGKNTTPFIHERLYFAYRPRCIMSCFTICVLYTNRTPENMAMVMRALSDSVREFVDAEAYRIVSTPIEKLARSQALFLYQIIRLFDGDVTLRVQGEKDIGLLKTWLGELCRIRDNLGDMALLGYSSIRDQSPVEWEKWIFAECVRRTIIMAYAVIGLYEVLRDSALVDPENPWAYVHRWTLGRSLWEASSSTDFQRSWKKSSHFVIANFTLGGFIENGKSEDVDDFAEIFLNVYMGGEALNDFMTQGKQEI
ncbi:hypothetical protein F5Y09DRAFT_310516 [Xylaria sp. FL1042]|nr:hypothetical protein F5Y09DRAFT_310516 [Xylaria sp. FL1042]